MWGAVQRYVHERRQGLVKSAAVLCGTYVFSAYVSDRLEEMKDKVARNKFARDNLQRRFQSTHDDVCFTIMTLVPTLATQILEDMDVEALTDELQSMSRVSRSRTLRPSQNQHRSQSISSVSDVHSDTGSVFLASLSGSVHDADRTSATSGSWIEHMSTSLGPTSPSNASVQLSDSITSTSTSISTKTESSTGSRSKGQLWNEIKILTLTRTLTTIYTITLLSLFTAVQLNVLARSRYIDSVRALDRAERARDDAPRFSVTEVLVREMMANLVDFETYWSAFIGFEDEDNDNEALDALPEQTEIRFLTLSWWVLHVGWKDVAARVRSSVESVFDAVSLKTRLSASELYRLLLDVRQHVEMEVTGGKLAERFVSSLLPPTPETTAHVLNQGGALPISEVNELLVNIDRPPLLHGTAVLSAPSRPSHNVRTAIQIEDPTPQSAHFPTPPSSQAHESDYISNASHSPSNISALHLQPTQLAGVSDSLATSRSTLETDPQFDSLLKHTRCYVSTPDFAHALACALDRVTEVLMDALRARVFVDNAGAANASDVHDAQSQPETGGSITSAGSDEKEVRIRLAELLPGLARWCQSALNATPNELVDNIMAVREVNALEAIIISDYEARFPAVS